MNNKSTRSGEEVLERAIMEMERMPVSASPGAERLLAQLSVQGMTKTPEVKSPRRQPAFIMRHAFQFTTAAAVVFVLLVAWLTLNSPGSIAFAEVVKAAINHKVVRYKQTINAQIKAKLSERAGEQFVPAKSEETVYCDLTSPRQRVERHDRILNDSVQSDWITIRDNQQGKTLILSSEALKVAEKDAKDADQKKMIRMFREGRTAGKKARLYRNSDDGLVMFTNSQPDKTFLETLTSFQDNPKVVTSIDTLDGRQVRKYQLAEQGATVWVDLRTKLPIRIEQEMKNPRPNVAQWKWTLTNFAWDVDIKDPAAFFSTTPPAGYALEDHLKD
jgi:hypothetical protein